MAKPPIPVGSYGKITTLSITGGQFEARCRFRDYDGVTRLVGRQGKTKTSAENNLRAALRERQGKAGAQINGDTPLADLGKAWLAEVKADEDIATGTKQLYGYVLNAYVEPAVGALRIREATVEHLRPTRWWPTKRLAGYREWCFCSYPLRRPAHRRLQPQRPSRYPS